MPALGKELIWGESTIGWNIEMVFFMAELLLISLGVIRETLHMILIFNQSYQGLHAICMLSWHSAILNQNLRMSQLSFQRQWYRKWFCSVEAISLFDNSITTHQITIVKSCRSVLFFFLIFLEKEATNS